MRDIVEHGRAGWIGAAIAGIAIATFSTLASQRAWVNDDAFITFRYAQNIAAGHGFVWNVADAQPVEGSSSLGWTFFNAVVLRLGGDPLRASHVAGWLAGALTLVLAGIGVRRVLRRTSAWGWVGGALLAVQAQWILWSVSGMETTAAACAAFGATLLLLEETRRVRGRGYASGIVFFVATLLRPESPLLHATAAVGIVAGTRGARPWRTLLQSGGVHAIGLAALTLVRLAYFGQPLPNTFYVKTGAPQWARGFEYVGQFVVQNHAWLWLVPLLVAAPLLARHARAAALALTLQIVGWCGWILALGGGRWEFRFFVTILPTCALLVGTGIALLATHGFPGLAALRGATARHAVASIVSLALLASQVGVLRTPFRPFGDVVARTQLLQWVDYMALEASLLAAYLTPDERVCTGWAGVFPYLTGAWHYDPWGLNQPEIARRPLNEAAVVFHQRHATWQDLIEHRVQFVDAFNHFLYPQAFEPARARNVTPWMQAGVPIYSVRLPQGHFWVFASTWPREEIEPWLVQRGLSIHAATPLPAGWPRLGQ